MGSSLAVSGVARFAEDIAVPSALQFASTNTYARESGGAIEFYVAGARSLTMTDEGGLLHGFWTFESSGAISDGRFKQDVEPLRNTLRSASACRDRSKQDAEPLRNTLRSTSGRPEPRGDGALWVLRELRPVSYTFRTGPDAKSTRFGFIAGELEEVAPNLVRKSRHHLGGDGRVVVYQDLVALLAAGMQSQMEIAESQDRAIEELLSRDKEHTRRSEERESEASELRAALAEQQKRLELLTRRSVEQGQMLQDREEESNRQRNEVLSLWQELASQREELGRQRGDLSGQRLQAGEQRATLDRHHTRLARVERCCRTSLPSRSRHGAL